MVNAHGVKRMIDTDKYEGHTPGPWYMRNHYNSEAPSVAAGKYDQLLAICGHGPKPSHNPTIGISKPPEEQKANAQLVADAPDLLAEVKRLQLLIKTWECDCVDKVLEESE
jgi:hypothetical protein